MTGFDRKIRKKAKEFRTPEHYDRKVDDLLAQLKEDHVMAPKRKPVLKAAAVLAALCIVLTGSVFLSGAKPAEAHILESFKQTILDFLGISEKDPEKTGVASERKTALSKPDLLMELQEVVMDAQNIYAVIKITAPPDMEFKPEMTFDYFGFCEGTNYNAAGLVPGATECTLLDVLPGKKNVGLFVASIGTTSQLAEGTESIIFFKDLIAGPYTDTPDVLVEGMWSLPFTASLTSAKKLVVKGTKDMKFPFAGKTAAVKKISLQPLGLTLVTDVTGIDLETLYTTDTRFPIRLRMIDGSEILLEGPNPEAETLAKSGSVESYEKEDRLYQKYVWQFWKALDIDRVIGIYLADYYVPFKSYD